MEQTNQTKGETTMNAYRVSSQFHGTSTTMRVPEAVIVHAKRCTGNEQIQWTDLMLCADDGLLSRKHVSSVQQRVCGFSNCRCTITVEAR